MYTEYLYNNSLAHHGIKGQKWGTRNGPPYPLSYKDHSTTEKKQNSEKKIDGISDKNKPKSSDNRLVKESKSNTKPKVEKSDTGYGTKTKITNERKASKDNDLDKNKISDYDWDYDLAEKFNSIGSKYLQDYAEKGEEEALRLLDESLKDYSYTFIHNNEKEIYEGEEYVYQVYYLNVKGNDFGYTTQGEEDYYDEDYFYKRKK